MSRLALLATVALIVVLSGTGVASAQQDASAYCQPGAPAIFDPVDSPAVGSGPLRSPGVRESRLRLKDGTTRLLESGRRRGKRAIVLVHGIPGSAADWADLMPLLGNRRTRVVAFDMPGYGYADDAWGAGRTPDVGARFIRQALRELGIKRVHLIAHDIGGPVALEWARRKPKRLRSATLLNTGLLLGYQDHALATISRPPGTGELFWLGLNRVVFSGGLTTGQTRPVPSEVLDRWYDDLDRETRCTILETYRSASEAEVDATARRQASALARNRHRPALVIWGAEDAYLPVALADDHMGIEVSDYARSKAFYERALAPLGLEMLMEPIPKVGGFGSPSERKPFFWIGARGRSVASGVHIAFEAAGTEVVGAFHEAAMAAGAEDNGGPGKREIYHPNYYGAFVLDPDGNNVEAVCHTAP